jgi:hypothetical protein
VVGVGIGATEREETPRNKEGSKTKQEKLHNFCLHTFLSRRAGWVQKSSTHRGTTRNERDVHAGLEKKEGGRPQGRSVGIWNQRSPTTDCDLRVVPPAMIKRLYSTV